MHGIQNLGKAVSLHLCMVQVTQQLVTPQQMTWLEVTQPRVTQQQHLMPLETLLLLFPQIKQLHLHHQNAAADGGIDSLEANAGTVFKSQS